MTDNETIERLNKEIDILIRKNETLKDEVSDMRIECENLKIRVQMLSELCSEYETEKGWI